MKLTDLNIYPIKSLSGISVQSSIIENKGLQFDRRWLLVDEKNEFLTQRNFARMATLQTAVSEKGLRVFNSESEINVALLPSEKEAETVKIWSSRVRADVYEREVNEWFSQALQTTCRLVLMSEETRRKVNYFFAVHKDDAVSFADAMPFLLTGENSLNDLNEKLDKKIPMNRFRPNFTVSGAEAFAEDNWKKIKIGETIFHVVKPCARCVVTTIDQITGISDGKEPLKTLATYRIPKRSVKKKIVFGQYLIAENAGGEIKIGDAVEILETRN
ncbi:MAG TPA: MOSC N-terminal beta barrel domain-containing protein [Pyrinomonadaceae bacterium]|nr:MOSC N-terminal beta barrel domain-containing protein [Pyrinomonadaceae bacterium]